MGRTLTNKQRGSIASLLECVQAFHAADKARRRHGQAYRNTFTTAEREAWRDKSVILTCARTNAQSAMLTSAKAAARVLPPDAADLIRADRD